MKYQLALLFFYFGSMFSEFILHGVTPFLYFVSGSFITIVGVELTIWYGMRKLAEEESLLEKYNL